MWSAVGKDKSGPNFLPTMRTARLTAGTARAAERSQNIFPARARFSKQAPRPRGALPERGTGILPVRIFSSPSSEARVRLDPGFSPDRGTGILPVIRGTRILPVRRFSRTADLANGRANNALFFFSHHTDAAALATACRRAELNLAIRRESTEITEEPSMPTPTEELRSSTSYVLDVIVRKWACSRHQARLYLAAALDSQPVRDEIVAAIEQHKSTETPT